MEAHSSMFSSICTLACLLWMCKMCVFSLFYVFSFAIFCSVVYGKYDEKIANINRIHMHLCDVHQYTCIFEWWNNPLPHRYCPNKYLHTATAAAAQAATAPVVLYCIVLYIEYFMWTLFYISKYLLRMKQTRFVFVRGLIYDFSCTLSSVCFVRVARGDGWK